MTLTKITKSIKIWWCKYTHPKWINISCTNLKEIEKANDFFYTNLIDYLKRYFFSWLNDLEFLKNKDTMVYADAWLGMTPFTSLNITWNDKRYAHKDEDDSKLGFIIWFTKDMTSSHCIRFNITSLCIYN
jgi:hypothetical protein